MKICFLGKNLNIKGGIGRYSRAIVENISKQRGIEVVVLIEEGKGDDYKLEKPILKKAYLLRNFLNIFINALKVRKYIKVCDIIHALDSYPYGVIAALANIGLNKKLIINGVGTYSVLPLDKSIKKNLLKWAYKKANKIVCISEFTKQQILKRIRLNNAIVINCGVDYKKYIEKRGFYANSKSKLMQNKKKIILSVAGGLKYRKGLHISVPAINEIKKKYPNINYHIVGSQSDDRNYFNKLRNLVKKYNLEKNVKFFQDISDEDLIRLYYQADIFLLTPVTINDNNFEGFGLVYLEAGACGKPVIGTYDCGAEDAVVDGVTGLLVSQNNIKKTAEAIIKLLDNPELARELGENGKKRAQEMSWDRVAKKYIDIYNKL